MTNRLAKVISLIAIWVVTVTPVFGGEANCRVAFVGDSLTANMLLGPNDQYPTLVSRLVRSMIPQNLGRPGSTLTDIWSMRGWVSNRSAVAAMSGPFRFAAVVILIGTNDWYHGVTASRIEASYRVFLAAMPPVSPVLCVTPPWRLDDGQLNKAGETLDDVRAAIARACETRGVVVDGRDIIPHDQRFYFDDVHPNRVGNRYLARAVAKALQGVL